MASISALSTLNALSTLKIGVIGTGKIASALVTSWLNKGLVNGDQVMGSAPKCDEDLLKPLIDLGCRTTHDNLEVGQWADIVLLAVKPAVVPIVARQLETLPQGQLLVSVAAGVGVSRLQELLGIRWRVIRAMPNTPVIVGEGATCICTGEGVAERETAVVEKLFSSVGMCRIVDEDHIDAITGLSGSGPAYMFMVLEAMADEGVRQGMARELAYGLAAQTMMGAAKMVLETGKHPGLLKDEVTSPGGTTIAGLRELEKGGLRIVMMNGVAAAAARARELNYH